MTQTGSSSTCLILLSEMDRIVVNLDRKAISDTPVRTAASASQSAYRHHVRWRVLVVMVTAINISFPRGCDALSVKPERGSDMEL